MNALFTALSRNKRRVAFLTLASTGAAVAFYYARAQYAVISSALAAERAAGARSLRTVYTASKRTVEATLRALLGPGRDRVAACDAADPDALVACLKAARADDKGAKERTWDELKVAAIVRLVASVYYVVVVHIVLLVQVNLVARYSTADADAPVEALGGGRLQLESKQLFLSLARRRLFEHGGIEALVGAVEEATREVVGGMRLSERVGPDDVRGLLRQICRSVEGKCGLKCTSEAAPEERVSGGLMAQPVLDVEWLLTRPGDYSSDSGESSTALTDFNVRLLVEESLDLCDVLNYGDLLRTSVNALMDVAGGLVDASLWGVGCPEGGRTVALAPVIAKIANVSKSVLGCPNPDALRAPSGSQNINIAASDGPFVDALLQMGECDAFGAAVFLSGEKSSST